MAASAGAAIPGGPISRTVSPATRMSAGSAACRSMSSRRPPRMILFMASPRLRQMGCRPRVLRHDRIHALAVQSSPRKSVVMARRPFTVGCLAGLVLAGAGCVAETNFSQRAGFKEFFAANPPADVAGQGDRELLRRHAPRFHLPAGHDGSNRLLSRLRRPRLPGDRRRRAHRRPGSGGAEPAPRRRQAPSSCTSRTRKPRARSPSCTPESSARTSGRPCSRARRVRSSLSPSTTWSSA